MRYTLIDKIKPKYKNLVGAVLFCTFGFLGVLLTTIGKHAMKSTHLDAMLLMSMRYILLFLFMLPMMAKNRFSFLQNLPALKLNIIKDALSTIAVLVWYKSAVMVPINNAITVAFLNPIFVIILDAIIRGRAISLPVAIGVVASFGGVCLVAGFDIAGFNGSLYPYLLIVLVSVLRATSSIVAGKVINKQDVKDVFYSGVVVQFLIATAVLFIDRSSMPNYLTLKGLSYVALLSGLFGIYYLCFLLAIRLADLSWLQPFDFLRTIFSAIISYILLGEVLHMSSAVGSMLVIAGVWVATKYGKSK